VALSQQAGDVLVDVRKYGSDRLHDGLVRFARSLALEVGAACAAGRPPAGTDLGDGSYAVDVHGEGVLLYYAVIEPERLIVITDLTWLQP
jgi:hypothetical protein